MPSRPPELLRRGAPLLMALLAAAGTQAFRLSCQWNPSFVYVELGVVAVLAVMLGYWSRRARRRALQSGVPRGWSRLEIAWTSWMVLVPILSQWIARLWDLGDAHEIVVLSVIQNGALAAALCAREIRSLAISVILSSFQLLFVSFVFPAATTYWLAGLGTVTVLWWMMEQYWSRIQAYQAARVAVRVPRRVLVIAGTLLLLIATMAMVRPLVPQQAWRQLTGWIPFSGGDRWGDVFARDGLGQGELLTGATDRTDTIGPVETNIYLSSQQPSLYDMVSRVYGPPSKRREQRIDVDGSDQAHQHEMMTFQTASREFTTLRRPRQKAASTAPRESVAMLFLDGRVPAHLRMQTFDEFDGSTWTLRTSTERTLWLYSLGAEPWVGVRAPWNEGTTPAAIHRHEVTLVNLQTLRMPLPSLPQAWHLDRVNRLSFFGWSEDDVPEMRGREQIPPLVPIHCLSIGVNYYDLLFGLGIPQSTTGVDVLGEASPATSAALARWQQSRLEGFQLVEQVEAWLRREFVHDDALAPPETCTDVVEWFLSEGRGPDYAFATTAAVLLRRMGFATRLVQGIYVDRRHYDSKAKKYVAWEEDIHTWTEIQRGDGGWIPLEPTPGFELPVRQLTLVQRAQWWGWATRVWMQRHWLVLTVFAGGLILAVRHRVGLADWCIRSMAPLLVALPIRTQVTWSARIVTWRWRLAGETRRSHLTWRAWLERLVAARPASSPARKAVSNWLEIWERMHYGQGQASQEFVGQARSACQVLLRETFRTP